MSLKDGFENSVNKAMEDDPQRAAEYFDVLSKLKKGYYNTEKVDILFQKWERFPLDVYDAAAFVELWGDLMTGKIAIAALPIDAEPTSDKDIAGMNERLSGITNSYFLASDVSSLKGNVTARFWGGTQDEDGVVEVKSPISFIWENAATDEVGYVFAHGTFPLEVGYTFAYKTLFQLRLYRRLARWPYGSKKLVLIVKTSDAELRRIG